MQKLIIVGNLCTEPELRTTGNGIDVCSFTVATKSKFRKDSEGKPVSDFFRVSAWRQLANVCATYLAKGKKVLVIGEAHAKLFQRKDGTTSATIEMNADEIEFLSPREEGSPRAESRPREPESRNQRYDRDQRAQAQRYADIEDAQWTEISEGDLPF